MAGKPGLSRLGTLWRVLNDRLIIKCEKTPKIGSKVYDKSMREVGIVSNIFGPVSQPFVEVRAKEASRYSLGEVFYCSERSGK